MFEFLKFSITCITLRTFILKKYYLLLPSYFFKSSSISFGWSRSRVVRKVSLNYRKSGAVMVGSRHPPRNLVDRIVGEKGLAGRNEGTAATGYAGVAIKRRGLGFWRPSRRPSDGKLNETPIKGLNPV